MDELQHINTETLEVDIKKLEQCIVKTILKIKKIAIGYAIRTY